MSLQSYGQSYQATWSLFLTILVIFRTWLRLFYQIYRRHVGGGSSGATAANRLSEDERFHVLLVEFGSEPEERSSIPFLAREFQKSTLDYQYFTTPQKHACLGLPQKRSYWPRGKCLGGSSVLNFMTYVRGNRKDFDGWAERDGCVGWNFDQVLPFFIKSENNQIPENRISGLHGNRGELPVSRPRYSTGLAETFIRAGECMGYQEVDFNGPNQTGFGRIQATIMDGERYSTERAFLRPIRSRPNLTILTKTEVLKIVLNADKKAEAICIQTENGVQTLIYCKEEIILCAGSIGSPILLMRSGIGPKDHLDEVGISLVLEAPGVGRNLQDHCGVGIFIKIRDDMIFLPNTAENKEYLEQYATNRSGPLTSPVGIEGMAFVNSHFANPADDYPDLQINLTSCFAPLPNERSNDMGLYDFQEEGKGLATVVPVLLRPKSRGSVTLSPSQPLKDPPIIDPQYLSHEDDIKILAEGIKISKLLVETAPFQELGAKVLLPKQGSTASYRLLAQTQTRTIFHPVGTCKMGSPSDSFAVVDPKLRLIGAKGLRVADASIMPTIVSGNTIATCIMIGERVADFIRNEHK